MHRLGDLGERICRSWRYCVRHRRIFLRFHYIAMAASTSLGTYILIAREVSLGWPPAEFD
jgi:hypothetical protein